MGSCASVHKDSPRSVMKIGSFRSKRGKSVIPESPSEENSVPSDPSVLATNGGSPIKSRLSFASTNKSFGSKDETFYDSQPWLESDCDEDFYSINGDFTPSRGNTPNHSLSGANPKVSMSNPLFEDKSHRSISNRSSATNRKKLLELFRESVREGRRDEDTDDQEKTSDNPTDKIKKSKITGLPPKSAHITPPKTANDKQLGSAHSCLPGLVSCRSFSDKKKKISLESL